MTDMKVFICHSWQLHSTEYKELCELISKVLSNQWHDLSISREKSYHSWKTGKEAWMRQNKLLQDQIAIMKSRVADIDKKVEPIAAKLSYLTFDAGIGMTEEEVDRYYQHYIDTLGGTVSEIITKKELMKKRCVHRKEILNSRDFHFLSDYDEKYNSLIAEKQSFEIEILRAQRTADSVYETFRIFEDEYVMEPDVKMYFPKFGTTTRRYDPQVKEYIKNRIISCDVFIAIAGMYSFYQVWMEYELNLATRWRKKIMALLPPGQEEFPREVINATEVFVKWDPPVIEDAIRRFADEISCH